MSDLHDEPGKTKQIAASAQLDEACDCFERAWRAGTRPYLSQILATLPDTLAERGFRELFQLELDYRKKSGSVPSVDEYRSQFPQYAGIVDELFRELGLEPNAGRQPVAEDLNWDQDRNLLMGGLVKNLIDSRLMTQEEIQRFQRALPPEKQAIEAAEFARELIRRGKLTKYQVEAVCAGRVGGLVIDQYVVLDKIGQGGMGLVVKAQHRTMKRLVAIKALQAERVKSAEAVQRFRREVETAAKLSHPNIVTAYDAREQDGVNYLIMEYVDGHDLAMTLRQRGPLPMETAVDYCLQAARGLAYAHKRGIVHRDIKPGNLLLDGDGTVKVLDMGLARVMGEAAPVAAADEQLTETGQVMGTGDYMAPEQAFDSHHVDARADIYSLGCTLYRLLTDRPPYSGESLVQVLVAHRERRFHGFAPSGRMCPKKSRPSSRKWLPSGRTTGTPR